jgi:hypothetical protein
MIPLEEHHGSSSLDQGQVLESKPHEIALILGIAHQNPVAFAGTDLEGVLPLPGPQQPLAAGPDPNLNLVNPDKLGGQGHPRFLPQTVLLHEREGLGVQRREGV